MTSPVQKREILHASEGRDTARSHTADCGDGARQPLGKVNVKLPERLLRRYQEIAAARGETFTSWIAAACADYYLSQRQRGRIEDLHNQIVAAGAVVEDHGDGELG